MLRFKVRQGSIARLWFLNWFFLRPLKKKRKKELVFLLPYNSQMWHFEPIPGAKFGSLAPWPGSEKSLKR